CVARAAAPPRRPDAKRSPARRRRTPTSCSRSGSVPPSTRASCRARLRGGRKWGDGSRPSRRSSSTSSATRARSHSSSLATRPRWWTWVRAVATSLAWSHSPAGRSSPGVLALAPRPDVLPGSRREVAAVGGLVGADARVLTAGGATEDAFRREAPQRRIVHLATYGVLNKHNPLFSFVELAPGGGQDGRLEVHEVFGLHLTADLRSEERRVGKECRSRGLAS